MRTTKNVSLLNDHGPISSEFCRIFPANLINLEMKDSPEQVIPVLLNLFSPCFSPKTIFLCLFPSWFWTTYFLRTFSHKIHQLIQTDTWGTAAKFTHWLSDQAPLDSSTTCKFWLTLEQRNDHSRRGCHSTVVQYVHCLTMPGWVGEWRLLIRSSTPDYPPSCVRL